MNRRNFIATGALATAAIGAGVPLRSARGAHHETKRIYKAIKFGMFRHEGSMEEKFAILKDIGYDGVELDSPGGQNKEEALAASQATGLPIHGVVDSIHWGTRLSDPNPEKRQASLEGLLTAIRESHQVGGSSVLLVPGSVTNAENENHYQVWQRSIEGIRAALPLATKLGIHILIENVWNRFLYEHDGAPDQTAGMLAGYIDEIGSPWVGSYFDIGNHRKYGKPEEWIRTLGRRIVKLDVKDWGVDGGWAKIGEGDVDWAEVRAALHEIGFSGWATAEVGGGGVDRMRDIKARMDDTLGE